MDPTQDYSVKLVFVIDTEGPPTAVDTAYDDSHVMVEERVVWVRATSFGHALELAEADAADYARDAHLNPYGQLVRYTYTGLADVFRMFESDDEPVREVFSATRLIPKGSDSTTEALANTFLGREEPPGHEHRRRFLNAEFNRPA